MRRGGFCPNVEQLENRLVPAGNVTVTIDHGALLIVGDNAANGIAITQSGDSFTVKGQDAGADDKPTKINGVSNGSFTGDVTGRININLGDGNNVLNIGGGQAAPPPAAAVPAVTSAVVSSGGSVTTPKGLSIHTGDGDDTINIQSTYVTGRLAIHTGAGNDDVTIDNSYVKGNTLIDTGAGKDTVSIDPTTFNGNLTIRTGLGKDTVTILGTTVNGNTLIDLGPGDDYLGIGGSSFNGPGGLVGHGGAPTTAPGDTYQDLGGDAFHRAGFHLSGFEMVIPFSTGSSGGGGGSAPS